MDKTARKADTPESTPTSRTSNAADKTTINSASTSPENKPENKTAARHFGGTDIALLAVSILFLVGTLTFFKSCGPADDGTWMTCHWANTTVTGVAFMTVLLALVHAIPVNPGIKIGLSLGAMILALLAIMVPGHLIPLCMMSSMRCRAIMMPGTILMAVLTEIAAVADILVYRRQLNERQAA